VWDVHWVKSRYSWCYRELSVSSFRCSKFSSRLALAAALEVQTYLRASTTEICSTVHAVDRVKAGAAGTYECIWVMHSGWQGFGDVGTSFVRALSPGPHWRTKRVCTSSAAARASRELNLLQRNDDTESSRQHQKYLDLTQCTSHTTCENLGASP